MCPRATTSTRSCRLDERTGALSQNPSCRVKRPESLIETGTVAIRSRVAAPVASGNTGTRLTESALNDVGCSAATCRLRCLEADYRVGVVVLLAVRWHPTPPDRRGGRMRPDRGSALLSAPGNAATAASVMIAEDGTSPMQGTHRRPSVPLATRSAPGWDPLIAHGAGRANPTDGRGTDGRWRPSVACGTICPRSRPECAGLAAPSRTSHIHAAS